MKKKNPKKGVALAITPQSDSIGVEDRYGMNCSGFVLVRLITVARNRSTSTARALAVGANWERHPPGPHPSKEIDTPGGLHNKI